MDLLEIHRELVEVAGPARRAQVETLAGWLDVDKWTPYGPQGACYVEFYLDLDAMHIRERASNRLLQGLSLDGNAVFGVWPVRFVPT